MILVGSRYMGQPVLTVPTAALGNCVAVFGPSPGVVSAFTYYTVGQGERFDTIAAMIYGQPTLWWRIADANPEVWYPDNLVAGSIIRIPS